MDLGVKLGVSLVIEKLTPNFYAHRHQSSHRESGIQKLQDPRPVWFISSRYANELQILARSLSVQRIALETRAKVKDKVNPLAQRIAARQLAMLEKQSRENTFGKAVETYLAARQDQWSVKHRQDVPRIFQKELLPRLGDMQMSAITKSDLKKILDSIVARNALTFVRDVLGYYGIAVRHYNAYSDHPVADYSTALRAYLPGRRKEKHLAGLPIEQLGELLQRLKYSGSKNQVRIGLELLIHLMVRTSELRGATWDEFNFMFDLVSTLSNEMPS